LTTTFIWLAAHSGRRAMVVPGVGTAPPGETTERNVLPWRGSTSGRRGPVILMARFFELVFLSSPAAA
jgi:hypothetical protein